VRQCPTRAARRAKTINSSSYPRERTTLFHPQKTFQIREQLSCGDYYTRKTVMEYARACDTQKGLFYVYFMYILCLTICILYVY
jgi:hypothetical protein